MGIFTGMIVAVEAFVETAGLSGAFLIAILESFIFPVPTATIIAPMAGFGIDPLVITLVATTGSIIGAVIGYALGKHFGRPVADRLFKKKHMDRVERWFGKWGAWAILIAAFTPLPFKVFTWCGGIFKVKFRSFLLASIVGRFLQFAIAAYVGSLLGPGILEWFSGI